jgi:hypothetical protein
MRIIAKVGWSGLLVGWLALSAGGLWGLSKFQSAAGATAVVPTQWPTDTRLVRAGDGDTLILLAHPKCPCTRATLGDLARLMAECSGKLKTVVLFVRPDGTPTDWEKTDLWESAAAIPGVSVFTDAGGVEAQRFGAQTSGQTILYDAQGKLLFQGGITAGRGHEGDNAGEDSIVALVHGEEPVVRETPVFGCPLCGALTSAGSLSRKATCQQQ